MRFVSQSGVNRDKKSWSQRSVLRPAFFEFAVNPDVTQVLHKL